MKEEKKQQQLKVCSAKKNMLLKFVRSMMVLNAFGVAFDSKQIQASCPRFSVAFETTRMSNERCCCCVLS